MSDFLDVPGASGAVYRFRRAQVTQLPATAGNLLVVTAAKGRRHYHVCAAVQSLGLAAALPPVAERPRGAQVFIRLNVARTVRQAEHADIVAAVQPDQALDDLA